MGVRPAGSRRDHTPPRPLLNPRTQAARALCPRGGRSGGLGRQCSFPEMLTSGAHSLPAHPKADPANHKATWARPSHWILSELALKYDQIASQGPWLFQESPSPPRGEDSPY